MSFRKLLVLLFISSLVCLMASTSMISPAAAGQKHQANGTARASGQNDYGQLGNGTNTNSNLPVTVSGLSGAPEIEGGGWHTLALMSDSTARAWGQNDYGQLGNGTNANSNTPVTVSGLSNATAIAGGGYHSLALLSDGTVKAWGRNNYGQLGNGTNANSDTPVTVSGLSGVVAIAGGGEFSLALMSDGTVRAWGWNSDGQLGDGTNTNSNVPVTVSGLSGVTAIAGGYDHGLALMSDGTARAWGYNYYGQLGNGSNTDSNVPVTVSGLTGTTAIAGGGNHSLALKSDGTVRAWGANGSGQLGNGTNTNSNVPVTVSGLTGVTAVAGGGYHSLALKNDGTAWAWGYNYYGQLGNGNNTSSNVPVQVSGLSGVTTVAGGGLHSLFLVPYTHSITVTQGTNGTITPAGTGGVVTVNDGADQAFTITPDTGCHIDTLTVDGVPVTPAPTYTFSNVTADHTITATFTRNSTWYLAEGTNAWGFNTYITITNPSDNSVNATLTYMDPNPPASGKGILKTRTITLPPTSQTTVSSMADIGPVDFSTEVTWQGDDPIAVDRTMFWDGPGSTHGYHSSIGTTTPSRTWYLPEGSSAWGFETWTLLLNPNPTAAKITLTYMTNDGPVAKQKTLAAHCRASYDMAQDIGAADASIEVTSDRPVVAERSMYNSGRREGSCSIGATSPSNDFYLPEGAVGYNVGFTTYVLVQNPNDTTNDVSITYQLATGPAVGPRFTMKPNSRQTVKVNEGMPLNTDVSTVVHGSKPLVAERAMYWDNGTGKAFHASIGYAAPHTFYMFPDGQTSNGFETWTLVENPNPAPVKIGIVYLPQGGGTATQEFAEIPAGSRMSFNMADKVKSGRASSLVFSLDAAKPILVERSMYMDNRGAGTDTIGAFPP